MEKGKKIQRKKKARKNRRLPKSWVVKTKLYAYVMRMGGTSLNCYKNKFFFESAQYKMFIYLTNVYKIQLSVKYSDLSNVLCVVAGHDERNPAKTITEITKNQKRKKVNEARMSEDDCFVSQYLSQFPKVLCFWLYFFIFRRKKKKELKSFASVYALFVLCGAFQANKRWFSERAWYQRRRIEMYSLGCIRWYTQTTLCIFRCV